MDLGRRNGVRHAEVSKRRPWEASTASSPERSLRDPPRLESLRQAGHLGLLLFAITLALPLGCPRPAAVRQPAARQIRDLEAIKQDCLAYLPPAGDGAPRRVAPADYENFRRLLFRPWHKDRHDAKREDLQRTFAQLAANPGYGENLRRHSPRWISDLAESADLERFPNAGLATASPWRAGRRAITIRNSNLRILPTLRPRYEDVNKAGDGYPFDTLQESAVWANTPILISHFFRDGDWVYAEGPFASGWMPAEDVAFVNDDFIAQWERPELTALVRDNVAIADAGGPFRFRTHIGAVFPRESGDEHGVDILIAVPVELAAGAGFERVAVLRRARLSKDDAATMPLAATPANIAAIANRMLGQPYGWGGLYEDRDCSATIRDLFTPFGLWLPRNSSEQAKAGKVVPLKHLPPEQREQRLLGQGLPFFTLVRVPGHIMLYIGSHQGRALVLHNFWGIRTTDQSGKEGRFIVGRCAITTLQPGIELPDIDLPNGDLRNLVESLILLGTHGGDGQTGSGAWFLPHRRRGR